MASLEEPSVPMLAKGIVQEGATTISADQDGALESYGADRYPTRLLLSKTPHSVVSPMATQELLYRL